jgi:hypothetical protein
MVSSVDGIIIPGIVLAHDIFPSTVAHFLAAIRDLPNA